jgi:hypothetical protein
MLWRLHDACRIPAPDDDRAAKSKELLVEATNVLSSLIFAKRLTRTTFVAGGQYPKTLGRQYEVREARLFAGG